MTDSDGHVASVVNPSELAGRNVSPFEGPRSRRVARWNHEALAKAIVQLEKDKDLALKLGQQGKQFVEQNFDRKNIAISFKERV